MGFKSSVIIYCACEVLIMSIYRDTQTEVGHNFYSYVLYRRYRLNVLQLSEKETLCIKYRREIDTKNIKIQQKN